VQQAKILKKVVVMEKTDEIVMKCRDCGGTLKVLFG